MRRSLAALVVFGLITAACSGDEPSGPAAGVGEGNAGDESEPATTLDADAAASEETSSADPGESGAATSLSERDEVPNGVPTTVPAEEMTPDELNVAYLAGRPAANQVAKVEGTYGEALDLMVNWIPLASGSEMARAMEAGDIDISYSQDLTSFASFVTGGSDLLLVGVAVVYPDAAGVRVFDIISTSGAFAASYPDIVTGFLQVTEDANEAYNDNREPLIDIIVRESGTDRESTIALLEGFSFPEKDAQLSGTWLGGAVQRVMKEQMDSRVAQGEMDSALGSYDAFVDTSFLEAVK